MSERDDIDTRASDLEGQLFTLARSEVPRADASRRALLALGVGAGVATAASMGEAAAAVKVGALAGGSVATGHVVKAVAVVSVLKWVAMGAVAGTVVLGGTVGVERLTSSHAVATAEPRGRAESEPAPRSPSLPTKIESQPMPSEPERVIVPSADRDLQRQVPAPRTSGNVGAMTAPVPPAVEGKTDSVEATSSLEEEVTRIDRARLALSNGSAVRALGELDEYDAKFPTGMMKPEATVVRIEAMVQNGNLAGAKALGHRFLSAHPGGGLSLRVHKVIGE